MIRVGLKGARPDDHGTPDVERAAALRHFVGAWQKQAARIARILNAHAAGEAAIIDWDAERDALTPVLAALMNRLAEVGGWDVVDAVNGEPDAWSPAMIEAYIAKAAASNADRWNRAVERGVTDASSSDVVRTFLASDSLATALGGAFMTEAFGFGRHDAAIKIGLGTKTWRVMSSNPRPSHAAQNGETVPIRDVFSNGLRWPGDRFGGADETAGCSCSVDYLP